jgi:Bacterial Ig-like domain (group 1)
MPIALDQRLPALALAALLPIVSGCRPPPEQVAAPQDDAVEVRVQPAELTMIAGSSAQLAAQINDAEGHPIGGAELIFSTSDPRFVTVSSRGFVTSVGPVGRAAVRVMSGARQATVPVRILPGKPSSIEKLGGDQQAAVVGTELPDPLRVRVKDASGNPTPGCRVRFTLLTATSVPLESAVCDNDGEAQAHVTLPQEAGPVAVAAAPEENDQVRVTFTLQAQPGPAAHVDAIEPMKSDTKASGDTVRAAVRVTDTHANGVAGVEVQWRIQAGGGSVDPAISSTDDSGIAAAKWRLGTTVGRNLLRASAPGAQLGPLDIALDAAPGPPAHLTLIRGANQTTAAGSRLRVPPAFRVTDAHGNAVPSVPVTFELADDESTATPRATVTDANGVATLASWVPRSAGKHELVARVTSTEIVAKVSVSAKRPTK